MSARWLVGMVVTTLVACGGSSESKDPKGGKNNGTEVECTMDCETSDEDLVIVGTPSGALAEGGGVVTIPIKLASQPTAPVDVVIVALEPTQVSVEPAKLTFDEQSWGTTQILTIVAVDDETPEADREVSIELSLVSDDAVFAGKSVPPITLVLSDDDGETNNGTNNGTDNNGVNNGTAAAIVVSAEGPKVSEAGGQVELEVQLSSPPDSDVFVPLAVSDDTEAEVDSTGLTFTALSWNVAQKITVTGIDDLEPDGDQAFDLLIGPTNSMDGDFDGLARIAVELTNVDGNCGNGVVDGVEVCEPDGSSSPTCNYGDMTCTYCGNACELLPGEGGGWCGDGLIQSAQEQCEGPREPCAYGEQACTTCDACQTVAGILTGYCGDGVVQGPEECDGGGNCTAACKLSTPVSAAKCLMISEYVEGTFYNKAIEIYNCDTDPVPLERYEICMARDADTGCSKWYDMQGTLQPGATTVICNKNADPELLAYCNVLESHVTEFNGDDRLFIYHDEDGDGAYDPTDTIVDAFGELATKPTGFEWADAAYARCDLTNYEGAGTWTITDYFELHPTCSGVTGCLTPDIYTGLGVAPSAGCP